MARLTEEMVIARTRASDLSNIRKLNCWGSELSDVSLLRKMHNVEVLSLSVNKISSLSDFQFCRNLQELYVRKNEIRDLNEIWYLQELPRLKNLWLDENPCAQCNQYRRTVLRALPNLQKLDNVTVKPEEVQDALRYGRELIRPKEMQDTSPDQQWLSESSSPAQSPTRQEEYIRHMVTTYYDEYDDPSERTTRTSGPGPQSPPRRQISEHETEPSTPHHVQQQDNDINYYDTDRRNANYEQEPVRYSRQHSGQHNSTYERSPSSTNHTEEPSPSSSVRDDMLSPHSPSSALPMKDLSPNSDDGYRVRSSGFHSGQESGRHHHGDSSSEGSTGSHYSNRGRLCDDDLRTSEERYRQPAPLDLGSQRLSEKGSLNNRPPYSRRPVTRVWNSNILSAVLCLIKELDYASLEVVEMAVRSRMDEI